MKYTSLVLIGLLLGPSLVWSQEKNSNDLGTNVQATIQRFLELRDQGQLDGIGKSDDVSDFSVYVVGSKLRKLESFKEVVKAGKGCHDLTIVDVTLPKRRLAYLFCSKKSPPEYIGAFTERENQWVLLPRKDRKD